MHPQRRPEDVLVIGAGPAGIASAYALERAGIRYKVIDRAERIASTWHHLYPSLRLNTTRFYSHMPGARFPLSYGIFPTGRQYYDYLLRYVKAHHFNIELGVEVQRILPEGDLWRVETDRGVCHYPAVIAATGVFGNPLHPDPAVPKWSNFAGWGDFEGQTLHAHDFQDPHLLTNKRVLVIGNGPSGVDITVAAADVAAEVYIAIRSGIDMRPRYPLGLPMHLWLMLADVLPKPWCDRILRAVGDITFTYPERRGLARPAPGQGSLTAYRGRDLLDRIIAERVTPISAPARFERTHVVFETGERLPFDVVIAATGYLPVLHQYCPDLAFQYNAEPFAPPSRCDWQIGPNGQRGWPLRDTSTHPNGRQVLGYPGLYLVGTFYKGKGAMHNFNIEARIAAEQIAAYLAQRDRERAFATT